jgi:hypothetical protein
MQKLITFNVIKSVCCYEDTETHVSGTMVGYCEHPQYSQKISEYILCRSKNCPVWKKLKTIEKSRASELLEEENKQLRFQLKQYISGHDQIWNVNKKLRDENDQLKKRADKMDNVNH